MQHSALAGHDGLQRAADDAAAGFSACDVVFALAAAAVDGPNLGAAAGFGQGSELATLRR